MRQVLKIHINIIRDRICWKCEESFSNTNFPFVMRLEQEKHYSASMCYFKDVEIQLFQFQHNKLMKILGKNGIDKTETNFISSLYWNQTATVRVDNNHTKSVEILRVLPLQLFNIHVEEILREALIDKKMGMSLKEKKINN